MDAGFPGISGWPLAFVGVALVLVALIGRTRSQCAPRRDSSRGSRSTSRTSSGPRSSSGLLPMSALVGARVALLRRRGGRHHARLSLDPARGPARSAGSFCLARRRRRPCGPLARRGRRVAVRRLRLGSGGAVAVGQPASRRCSRGWASPASSFVMVLLVAVGDRGRAVRGRPVPLVRAIRRGGDSRPSRSFCPRGRSRPTAAMRVAAVQGNGKAGYFDERRVRRLAAGPARRHRPAVRREPSTSCSGPRARRDDLATRQRIRGRRLRRRHRADGCPAHRRASSPSATTRCFNTSVLWRAGEGAVDYYDKQHPVPVRRVRSRPRLLAPVRARPHRPGRPRVHAGHDRHGLRSRRRRRRRHHLLRHLDDQITDRLRVATGRASHLRAVEQRRLRPHRRERAAARDRAHPGDRTGRSVVNISTVGHERGDRVRTARSSTNCRGSRRARWSQDVPTEQQITPAVAARAAASSGSCLCSALAIACHGRHSLREGPAWLRRSVIVPTYNEIESLEALVGRLRQARAARPTCSSSTTRAPTARARSPTGSRQPIRAFECCTAPARTGSGRAYLAGFVDRAGRRLPIRRRDRRRRLARPGELPAMLELARNGADLVIGSRWVAGGAVRQLAVVARRRSRAPATATRARCCGRASATSRRAFASSGPSALRDLDLASVVVAGLLLSS